MELDDLKKTWQETEPQKIKNTNIMELIHHKSYGPIAALKKAFRRQMLVMLLIPFLLLASNSDNLEAAYSSALFWSYVAFCIGIIIMSYNNYRTVKKMETMDGIVKANIKKQTTLLETRLSQIMIGGRIALLYFIVLLEVLPHFQHYRMLDKWHGLSPLIRYGSYAGFLVFQYFMSKRICKIKFGDHIAYLKSLVAEMHD